MRPVFRSGQSILWKVRCSGITPIVRYIFSIYVDISNLYFRQLSNAANSVGRNVGSVNICSFSDLPFVVLVKHHAQLLSSAFFEYHAVWYIKQVYLVRLDQTFP